MVKIANAAIKKSLEFINKSCLDDAVDLLKKTLRKNPSEVQALNILGQVYLEQKKYDEAIECFEKSLKREPHDFEIISRLGYAYEKSCHYTEAIETYKQSLSINPKQGHIYDCLGRALAKDARDFEALPYMFKALEFNPEDAVIHNNIAFTAKNIGLYDLAEKHYSLAVELDPQSSKYLSCLVFQAHKNPARGPKDFLELGQKFYHKFIEITKGNLDIDVNSRLDPNKTKFKVGFVSADMRTHPVSALMYQVFELMNKELFDIYIYSANEYQDNITEKIKAFCKDFKIITKMTDLEAAQLIAQDEIDVLFDLSGYTKGARLGIFKIKPAPVQVSYVGYFATLGMPQMDFIIADNGLVHEGEEKYFTETVYKFPDICCHAGLYDMPEPSTSLPYDRNGYITFGIMNSFHKLSPDVLAMWANIIKTIPNSKILFNNRSLGAESAKNYLTNIFTRNGVDTSRLIIRSSQPRSEFLESYNDIDIALDPFPYGGGTTTLESLLMNVPVISIDGDRWMARHTSGCLRACGYPELIAKDQEDYKLKAIGLAVDIERLRSYRQCLKTKAEASELNINKHTLNFEQAIRDMWLIQCKKIRSDV